MKALKPLVLFLSIYLMPYCPAAQSGNALPTQRALVFADSLLNAFRYSDWPVYMEISYPGIIKYYGGTKAFQEYVQRTRTMSGAPENNAPVKTEIIQIVNEQLEWQCVVKKTQETTIDGKKASIVSYLVGQSKDEGLHWKYVDVAFNSVANIIYIMPDIFESLSIPQRQIIFEKDALAKMQ